jgi:hypothetical protein
MADYTKKIFEMLGVEPEEEFRLKFDGGDSFIQTKGKYKLDKSLRTLWFNDNIGEWRKDLDAMFLAILNGTAQIVKIPHPTAEEQLAIDYARACGFKWMAKDEGGTIHAFEHKPVKSAESKYWFSNELYSKFIAIGLPISFLSWEDEEPYYIGE